MPSIFVSYARRDAAGFVEWLQEKLTAHGREPWVDWTEIPGGAVWLDQIHRGIEGTDTFVFVLTAGSIESSYCKLEIDYAVGCGKRVLWIKREQTDEDTIPVALKRLQWISFLAHEDPEDAFDNLIRAIDSDLEWEQQKTTLLGRAKMWERGARDESFLLRGEELKRALSWQAVVSERPGRIISLPIWPYIEASQDGQARELARLQELYSKALGRELAAQSEIVRQQGADLLERSVLLAAEAMTRFPSLEADQALRKGLILLGRALLCQRHERPVEVVKFSADGLYFAAGGRDGIAHLCRTPDGAGGTTLVQGAEVHDLDFSPDARLLVTAGGDGVAIIWDIPEGRARVRLAGGQGLSRVRFSADGSAIATASWDGLATVWESLSGQETMRVKHDAAVLHLAFSPGGRALATASQDGSARAWDIPSGREIYRVETAGTGSSARRSMTRVAYSSDGERLAVACADGIALLCDAHTGAVLFRLEHSSGVGALAFSPDGKWLATGEGHGAALWDARSGRLHRRLPQVSIIWDVAFDALGKTMATGGNDGTARVWDCDNGEERVRTVHAHAVYSVALSPDGRLLATASADHAYDQWLDHGGEALPFHGQGNAACLWEARGGALAGITHYDQQVMAFERAPINGRFAAGAANGEVHVWSIENDARVARGRVADRVRCLQFSPDERRLAVGGLNGVGCILDAYTGDEIVRLEGIGSAYIDALGWAADGSRLAAGLGDGTVRVWDAATGSELSRRELVHKRVNAVLFHPDGVRVISAGGDGIGVWDAVTGKDVFALASEAAIVDLSLSPDGVTLATANGDSCAQLYNLKTGQIVGRLVHGGKVLVVRFSSDAALLATGAEDHCARLWDPRKKQEKARFQHEDNVWRLAFSPDGRHLATGCWDRTSRIWDLASAREVARMTHPGPVSGVAFSLDGGLLVTASNRTVRRWLWQPDTLLSDAASRVTRNLTPDEWRQYLPGETYRLTFAGLTGPGAMVPQADQPPRPGD